MSTQEAAAVNAPLEKATPNTIRIHPVRVLKAFFVVVLAVCVWLGWSIFAFQRQSVDAQKLVGRQEQLCGTILWLDEVLTMSARLGAAFGDEHWERRYGRYEPELDAALGEMQSLAPAEIVANLRATNEANQQLVEWEKQSFQLVRAGKLEQAREILLGKEYERVKEAYRKGLDDFLAANRATHAQTITKARESLLGQLAIIFAGLVALLMGALWQLQRHIVDPLRQLATMARQLSEGDLGCSIAVTTQDEIGRLQESFNRTSQELQERQKDILARQVELEAALEHQRRLAETIRELAIPVIPVTRELVVLPIVGYVDSRRASDLMQQLLEGTRKHEARTAILDITGISSMDSTVLQFIIRAVKAALLTGTEVVIVGFSPAMAQTVVEQGLELPQVRTYRDLRTALAAHLRT